ncbi:MAG: RHS repeat-associated core domain-containing protein, partial [bacterium]
LIVGNELLVSATAYQQQRVVTADLEASYAYDNEGKMTGMHHPSSLGSNITGDTYSYGFDSLGRPVGLTDQTTMQTAVSGVTYGPAGEMLTINYGGVNETRTYNNLLQLTALSAYHFGRQYSYSGTANNGKIQSETDTVSGETVTYQHDKLTRLMQATSNSASAPWGQSFAYDGFGNLTDKGVTSGSAPTYHTTFDPATNREYGAPYDANGNRVAIPGMNLGYDIENRMVTALPPLTSSTEEVYSYGRGNRRVYAAHWQWDGTTYYLFSQKVYFYSVTGQKLGTYQLGLNDPPPGQGTPSLSFAQLETRMWFGGKLVMANGNPVAPDRLGSLGRYYPYGEDRTPPAVPNDREKFATYTRDSATGLDYAVNRYYYNVSGRFMSADPYVNSAGPKEPGSWNRYAYTRGDPTNRIDPSGLDDSGCGAFDEDFCEDSPILDGGTFNDPLNLGVAPQGMVNIQCDMLPGSSVGGLCTVSDEAYQMLVGNYTVSDAQLAQILLEGGIGAVCAGSG